MKKHTRRFLVLNEGTSTPPPPNPSKEIQRVTCNLLPKLVRHDSMEGRNYLVVPMVILTEGVHCGSEGPLYYPPAELSKTPVVWNHKPVVVYHPEINGQGVSACDPNILTNRKVGMMMNTRYEKGKLKSEAWIEKDRANVVDERIMKAIDDNEMMELSTGVFVDAESTEGEWNGEAYKGIARNFRPDHLALLPDKTGACSIKDGAGFLRNEKGKKHPWMAALRQMMVKMGIAENEMPFSSIQYALQAALEERLGTTKEYYSGPYCYVCEVYSNFVVYGYDGKYWQLGYTSTDAGVTLDEGDPVEVERVPPQYRKVAEAVSDNQQSTKDKVLNNTEMKKTLVDAIILAAAALAGSWGEQDRDTLMAMNEDTLKKVQERIGKPPVAAPAPAPAPAPVPAPAANATPAPAPAPKPVSVADYVASAPPEVQQVLNHSLGVYNAEKNKLVATILAVKNHTFTKEDLERRPLEELQNLAALAGAAVQAPAPRQFNYGGQAPVPAANGEQEEVMLMPTINFDKTPKTVATK